MKSYTHYTRRLFIVILVALAAAKSASAETDAVLTTASTPENMAKGQEIDAYQLGVAAYVYGYPLVRMENVMREYITVPENKPTTSYRAPLNQIGWARELATAAAKDMPTANNDTLYLSAVVQLNEPYLLSVPDVAERYYVVDVFDMWQELEHYIGRRTTGTKAGVYALVPPGWKGELPQGVTRLDVGTDIVWLWGRLRVSPNDDMAKIHALQDQFDLRPLSAWGKSDYKAAPATLPPMPKGEGDFAFFTQLAAALKDNPPKPADEALVGSFARIGLTKDGFDPSKLTAAQKKGLTRALADAPLVPVAALATQGQNRNGWNYVRGMDEFGFNYPLRALVSGPYLGGQGEKEAVYPIRYADAEGNPLTGQKTYQLELKSQPPNDAFWSLTMYDAKTKMLIANEINRFKISDDTPGLKVAPDGSVKILISHTKPEEEDANWLPAPEGGFYLILRVYQPKEAILDGSWEFPQVEPVK